MNYIIRIGDRGYFGRKPWTPVPREEAFAFPTMKQARKTLNRLNGRLMKNESSEIEPRNADHPCGYVPASNEPCETCPRKITALYRCGLLQEAVKESE